MERLSQILERLNRAHVDYVIVGGMAAVFHGVPLVTRDIHICLPLTQENLLRLETALSKSAMTAGAVASNRTTSRMPRSFGSAIVKPLEVMSTTTAFASGVMFLLSACLDFGEAV